MSGLKGATRPPQLDSPIGRPGMDARAVTSATAPPLPPAAKPSASTPAPPSTRGSAPTGGASAEESQFDADVWERLYRRMAVTPEPEPAERTVAHEAA